MDVEGEIPWLSRFKLPMNVVGEDLVSRISARIMGGMGTPKFRVVKDACTQCDTCARGCPRGAITLSPYPTWDYGRCIGCYCCYELCEQNAIRLAGRFSRAGRSASQKAAGSTRPLPGTLSFRWRPTQARTCSVVPLESRDGTQAFDKLLDARGVGSREQLRLERSMD